MKRRNRAAAAAGPESPASSAKRRRLTEPDQEDVAETPEATTEKGLKIIDLIKKGTDRFGNLIAESFLDLPSRKDFPDYYVVIGLPLSVNGIEASLNRHEYPNLSALEGDLRRMVSNAKGYNEKNSSVYSDAERIRKIIAAFMQEHNPVYKLDPKATVPPTPVPERVGVERSAVVDSPTPALVSVKQGSKRSVSKPTPSRPPREPKAAKDEEDFRKESYQSAQEKIIEELIDLKDKDGDNFTKPFHNKPHRVMFKEYYALIKHPQSLKGIQRLVQGVEGKKPPTGISLFPNWDAFEKETSYIWLNAREFNEDGSEIVEYAETLREYFERRLAAARKVVAEPQSNTSASSVPRLKLKLGATKTPEPMTKLKLRLGQRQSETPGSPSVTNNDTTTTTTTTTNNNAPAPVNQHTDTAQAKSESQQSSETSAKTSTMDSQVVDDKKMVNGATTSAVKEAPTEVATVSSIGSSEGALGTNGLSTDGNHLPPPPPRPAPPPVISPIDNRFRRPGKGVEEALIHLITMTVAEAVRPGTYFAQPHIASTLNLYSKQYKIPASPTLTQHSTTFVLPGSTIGYQLDLSVELTKKWNRNRQSQLIFYEPLNNRPGFHMHSNKTSKALHEGINRFEVMAVSGPLRGAPRSAIPADDIDYECFTLLFFVQAPPRGLTAS